MTLMPPADRDLPAGRAGHLRAGLLRRVHRRSPARWRVALAAAAVVVTAVAVGLVAVRSAGADPALALTAAEMNRPLRSAAERCLRRNDDPDLALPDRNLVGPGDEVLSARSGRRSAVLFLTDIGYLACDETRNVWGGESSGAWSTDRWAHPDWMPGPVEILILTSSEADGGAVTALGRVSSRVGRVTVEHGTGRITEARLGGGVFGLLSATGDVRADAELVAYDRTGAEIYRRKLLQPAPPACWSGPDGSMYYGEAAANCTKAEPWSR